VYNEEINLPRLFDRLRADLASLSCAWRVIFVDDGSHDHSWELISAAARQDHADLQNPPAEIPKLIAKFKRRLR
jgi:glycosyltransferase involved in cell wall biosynthesis